MFRRLEINNIGPTRVKFPASIVASVHYKGTYPIVVIGIRKILTETLNWKNGEKIQILLGEDEDKGKLQIVRDISATKGPAIKTMKKGGVTISIGYREELTKVPRQKVQIFARKIDEDTIEIDLPDWSKDTADVSNKSVTTAYKEPTLPPQSPSKPPIHFNGVTISTEKEKESVTFKGKSVEVSSRQAQFISLLARTMPKHVAEIFIIDTLWGSKKQPNTESVLKQIKDSCVYDLEPLSLTVVYTKGVGYALKEIG